MGIGSKNNPLDDFGIDEFTDNGDDLMGSLPYARRRKKNRSSRKPRHRKSKANKNKSKRTRKSSRSNGKIKYTKNGQPYVITSSGKAKFIKRRK